MSTKSVNFPNSIIYLQNAIYVIDSSLKTNKEAIQQKDPNNQNMN